MGHKGHWGEYTGNAKWSKDHAHTKVTKDNYKATERDDAAHIDYLKRDIDYDNKHGHSDENMTADEKHISKLAGDMKYDKEHNGSPAKKAASSGRSGHPSHMRAGADNSGNPNADSADEYWRKHQQLSHHTSAKRPVESNSAAELKYASMANKLEPSIDYRSAEFDYDAASDAGVFDKEKSSDREVRRAQRIYKRKSKK